ncbi:MAG: hypothetical protein U1F77_11850, partial [Kiritimatiellia bacterium]
MTGGQNRRLVDSSTVNWLLGYHGGTQGDAYYNGWVNDSTQAVNYGGNLYAGMVPGPGVNSLVYQNGLLLASNQTGTTAPGTLRLGGGAETSFGDIGELLVFDSVLTEEQRLQVEQYLQAKWQGVLPATSPVSITASGAILDLNGQNQQIGSLSGVAGSRVRLNGGWLSTGMANVSSTFAGVIEEGAVAGGGLTKNGTGDLILEGTESNTYTGLTVLGAGRLGLAKTGGAYAISGNFTGINNASPEVYTLADNQFAPGTVMYFQGNEGDHVRFELLGTTQTLAGIDNSASSGRGVIQHNEQSGRTQVGAASTLILNGAGTYSFNGYLRNYGLLNVIKNGTGTQTLTRAGDRFRFGTTAEDLASLTLNSGVVNVGNTYVVFGEAGGGATGLTINGGIFNHTGTGGTYLTNATGAPSTLTVNAGGSYLDAGPLWSQSNAGTMQINGGTVSFALGGGVLGNGGTGVINLDSGALTFAAGQHIGGAGTAWLNQTGGTTSLCGQMNVAN